MHPCRLTHDNIKMRNGEESSEGEDVARSPEKNRRTRARFDEESDEEEAVQRSEGNTEGRFPNADNVSTVTNNEKPGASSLYSDKQSDTTDEEVELGDNTVPGRRETTSSESSYASVEGNKKPIETIPKKNQDFRYRLTGQSVDQVATCIGRAGKASSQNTWHYINIRDHSTSEKNCVSVLDMDYWEPVAEDHNSLVVGGNAVISDESDVLIVKTDIFADAKMSELKKWKTMGVYSEVDDIGQKRISTQWVCCERLKAGHLELEARLCARGCEDIEDVPTDSPTCERDNVRILLSIAASFGWEIHSIDFKSAYLQGEDLDREIFLKPPKEANSLKLWRLNKCVYGINDAGKKWYNQLRRELLGVGAEVSSLDQALFFSRTNEKLSGIMVLHVDDTLWAGDKNFSNTVIQRVKQKFLVSTEEHGSMRYLGLSVKNLGKHVSLNLDHYASRLKEMQLDIGRPKEDTLSGEEAKLLRVLSGQLNWLPMQSRPDLAYSSCHIATSLKNSQVKDAQFANKIVRKAKGSSYNLSFSGLGDPRYWRLICFSDASWGNLPEGGSQGAYLIFLVGADGTANIVSWQSKRLRRVARSTIAAETLAVMNACEAAFLLSKQIAEIIGSNDIPITLATDNESLANAIRSTTSVEEKRLRVDISALREMIAKGELADIKWISTSSQLADSLTKQGAKCNGLIAVVTQRMRIDPTHLQLVPNRHE